MASSVSRDSAYEKVLVIAYSDEANSGWGRITNQVLRQFKKLQYDYRAIFDVSSPASLLKPPASLLHICYNMIMARREARDATVVHAFDVWPYALYGFAAVLGTRKKLFVTGVGTYSVAPFAHAIQKWLLLPVMWRTEKILTISDYTARKMIAFVGSADKFTTVYLGATALPDPSSDEVQRAKEKYNITGSPVVVTVGEVKDRKGQWDTVRAIELLKEQFPNILYLIVGNVKSEYAAELCEYVEKHELENNVRIITDAATDTDLAALYASAHVFALNSTNDTKAHHFEGFGLVFLEAYQFGLPAVGSENCGIEDAIADGYTGYLTKQRDPKDIAEKLLRLLNQEISNVRANISQYRSGFNWEETAKQYIYHYSGRRSK